MVKEPCYHCGETCNNHNYSIDDHLFCCNGCLYVYSLLKDKDLCDYYAYSNMPGITAKGKFNSNKYSILDNPDIEKKIIQFKNENSTHVLFQIPGMHCSSCIWLLENFRKVMPAVLLSRVDFSRKELYLVFNHAETSLRQIVQTLAFIGYEPYISLEDLDKPQKTANTDKAILYKLGIAGFCFGNIMMLSLPEYFSQGNMGNSHLKELFTWLSLLLSLPVVFYSASEFYVSAYKGLRQKKLNIDVPIVLAILVTFVRSCYELVSNAGPGYFDSMSGIVFFMLVGRVFQSRSFLALSFERDYRSYFPLSTTKITKGHEEEISLHQIKVGDTLLIRNHSMIPADSELIDGEASLDYSFVTGEAEPVKVSMGQLLYAGGKQCSGNIKVKVLKEVSQSYLTQLWNNDSFKKEEDTDNSFVHKLSTNFTLVLLLIVLIASLFWAFNDPSRIFNVVTTMLIIACPCALLLSATFTNGAVMRVLGRNKMYLKNSQVISKLAAIHKIVFDKTGTLTEASSLLSDTSMLSATESEWQLIQQVAYQSEHPISKAIVGKSFSQSNGKVSEVIEKSGYGIQAKVNNHQVKIGNSSYVNEADEILMQGAHVSIDGEYKGLIKTSSVLRPGMKEACIRLIEQGYPVFVISGDSDKDLSLMASTGIPYKNIKFQMSPLAKLNFIQQCKADSSIVAMIGDGLNDAGALKSADVGIALSESSGQFTPCSDAILQADKLYKLPQLLQFCKRSSSIIKGSFVISLLYNIAGLYFALQGILHPVIAAILMPLSTASIVLFTILGTRYFAYKYKLDSKLDDEAF